MFKIILKLLN